MRELYDLLSARVAHFFVEISAIPRSSGEEARIADYLERFAADRGLEHDRDAAHNVFIRKAGTAGREKEAPLLLQAHSDMVTEVAFGYTHDFSKEGVSLCMKDGVLFANGTTLGADDAFGMALMLAVLDGGAESHPPLECLFTAAEEIGLVGAGRFDYSCVRSRRMLNFDSAEEDLVITGCCGGIRSAITLPVVREVAVGTGLRITLSGLCGGHSGEDIHRGRANALITMGTILKKLEKHTPFAVVSISGGDKDNAIPRDCTASILPQDMAAATAFFADAEAILSESVHVSEDERRTLTAEPIKVSGAMSGADTARILAVLSVPNGVLAYRASAADEPETSRNLASVRTEEDRVRFCLSSRSPFDSRLQESCEALEALAEQLGGTAVHSSYYPGWEGAESSPVSALWQKCYRETTGRDISAKVIHAGLECGLISARLPGLDVISVGCNIYDLHTPAERMEVDSLERIYRTLLAFLKGC